MIAFRNPRAALVQIPRVASTVLLAACLGCLPNPCDSNLVATARQQLAEIQQDAAPVGAAVDMGLRDLGDWEALPVLRADSYQQFSSFNRRAGTSPIEPGEKDFNNFIALSGEDRGLLLALTDGPDPDGRRLGGYVLAAVDDGPGYVSRMFFTRFGLSDLFVSADFSEQPGSLGRFENEILRVYVDDLATPAFVIPLRDIGIVPPFQAPLAGTTSLATVSYTPISFTRRLRVVLDGLCTWNGYYYHVNVKQTTETMRAFSPRLAEDPAYSAAESLLESFGDNPNVGFTLLADDVAIDVPGGGTARFADADGGTIELLRFAFDPIDSEQLRQLTLEITYDGAAAPAVNVPLGAFFGCREQIAPLKTLPMRVAVEGKGLDAACYLPMPYAESISIVLRNTGPESVVGRASIGVDRSLPGQPWGYLHAWSCAVEGPQPAGSLFEVLSVTGRGRYVGTFLLAAGNTDPRSGATQASLNILEGNELGIIDGEPRIFGTGTEDYYNGGFYFATGPFDHPFAAANYVKGGISNDPGIASCCRWHVLSDAVDFEESFALRFQYASDNPALVVRYATVAYYYLDRPGPGSVNGGNWLAP